MIIYFLLIILVFLLSYIFNWGSNILILIPSVIGWYYLTLKTVIISNNECLYKHGIKNEKISLTRKTVISMATKTVGNRGNVIKIVSGKQEVMISCGLFSRKQLTTIAKALTDSGCKADKTIAAMVD